MLILLPPSEGKTAPAAGTPVSLSKLSHPELTDARHEAIEALVAVSIRADACEILEVGPTLADEVARNVTVREAPADAAARVYTGVLYDAAGMDAWDDETLARAGGRIRIVSALWGLVSPADRIPAYRLSMGTTLPSLGALAPWWKPRLAPVLDELGSGLVVDCRSSAYGAAWKPRLRPDLLAVRVERELNGKRSVVSHHAKHTRGVLTAHLARLDVAPESPQDVADAAAQLIGTGLRDVELTDSGLTLVV